MRGQARPPPPMPVVWPPGRARLATRPVPTCFLLIKIMTTSTGGVRRCAARTADIVFTRIRRRRLARFRAPYPETARNFPPRSAHPGCGCCPSTMPLSLFRPLISRYGCCGGERVRCTSGQKSDAYWRLLRARRKRSCERYTAQKIGPGLIAERLQSFCNFCAAR